MIDLFRRISESFIAKFLIGLILIGFIYSGFGSFSLSRSSYIAKVGNVKLSRGEFLNLVKNNINYAHAKGDYSQSEKDVINDDAQVKNIVDSFITDNLFSLELASQGLLASDTKINSLIRKNSDFFENGKFSTEKFYNFLNRINQSEEEFKDNVRFSFLKKLLYLSLNVGFATPKVLVSNYSWQKNAKFYGEKVVLTRSVLPLPDKNELEKVYKEHKFLSPEYRQFEVIKLTSSSVLKKGENLNPTAAYAKLVDASKDLEDVLASGESYKDVAGKFAAEYLKTPLLQNDLQTSDGKKYEAISDKLLKSWMDLGVNQESQMQEEKGAFYIAKVSQFSPSESLSFEAAYDQVAKIVQDKAWQKYRDEILAINGEKENRIKLPKGYKDIQVMEAEFSSKDAFYNEVDSILSQGKFAGFIKLESGEEWFIKLHKMVVSAGASGEKNNSDWENNLNKELLLKYLDYLKDKYEVEINEDAINEIRKQNAN